MQNKIENIYKREQNAIVDLFCFIMLLTNHVFLANAIGRTIWGSSAIDTLFVYAILAWFIYKALPALFRTIDMLTLTKIVLLLLFIGLSVLINDELNTAQYSEPIRTSVISVIVGIYVADKVTDIQLLEQKLCKISVFAAIEMIVSFAIYHFILKVEWGTGAMGLSYLALIPTILVFYCLLKKFDIKKLILLILLIAIIILQGSRGPLVATMAFPLIYLIVNGSHNPKKTFMLWVMTAIIVALVINFLPNILLWLSGIIRKYDFYSKTVEMLLSGEWLDPNGRDFISQNVLDIIKNNPIGMGFFGERPILETYCHNMFLEFVVDFGIAAGGLFILAFVAMFIRKLVTASIVEKNVIVILFCAFVMKLFFSGSFWTETMFFAFVTILFKKRNFVPVTQEDKEVAYEADFNN